MATDGAENGAAGVGFVNPLDRLTGGAEGFDLSQSWTAIQDRAMTAMSEVDDLRRQGLQKAREQASSVREKASHVEFFNLDGLQEKDPYMVTAAAPAAAPAAAAPAPTCARRARPTRASSRPRPGSAACPSTQRTASTGAPSTAR